MKTYSILFTFLLLGVGFSSCKKISKGKIKGDWHLHEGFQEYEISYSNGGMDRYSTTFETSNSFVELYAVDYSSGTPTTSITYNSLEYDLNLSFFKKTFKADVTGTNPASYSGTWESNRKNKINKLLMESSEFGAIEPWELNLNRNFTISSFSDNAMTLKFSTEDGENPKVYIEMDLVK